MYRRIIILAVLACFCQTGLPQFTTTGKPRRDIIFDKDPVTGSGQGGVTFEDDEDLSDLSGSGSGSGSGLKDMVDEIGDILTPTKKMTTPIKMTTTLPTTSSTTAPAYTICLHMRKHSKRLPGSKYTPRCTSSGEFDALQCSKHAGTDDCWCSDLEGTEIPGTRLGAPNIPDCDEGTNLTPCPSHLVKNIRSRLYGAFRPRCASDGQFERIQCQGSMCFCVDEGTGKKVDGTELHIPATPNCDDDSLPYDPEPTDDDSTEQDSNENEVSREMEKGGNDRELEIIEEEGKDTITVDVEEGPGIDVVIKIGRKDKDKSDETDDKDDDDDSSNDSDSDEINKTGNDRKDKIEKDGNPEENRSRVPDNQILTEPGLLGGIIGGSVVLLLGIVLLIMFIVYRMRKKDEGSYPLDEPRKLPNYSYVRAPEKEYYA